MDASEKLDDEDTSQVPEQTNVKGNEECDGNPEEEQKCFIPDDMYYNYEELCSRPFITADSNIPPNLLHLSHSFGYDCGRRGNLQLLDEHTLAFIAGNLLVLLDIHTKEQRHIRSSSGGGIGAIMTHPSKQYLAVAEKGHQPNIIIYEYPSLRPYRILREGTSCTYSFVDFNRDGSLLASVGGPPDYMLTIWDWKQEQVTLSNKAYSQEIYRVTFSPDCVGQLTTSGSGHIRFWKMASTFTGLKLQGLLGRFGKTTVTDIEGYVELPDGKVVSGSDCGNMLLWEGGLIKVEICRKGQRTCHAGTIHQFNVDEGELMTIGSDGAVRSWNLEIIDAADAVDDTGLFEIEPVNEILIGRNVSLFSMVKSSAPESSIWFAQDSNGGIWKLDLSFSNITQCLFSFHSGAIQGLDVSGNSHLMATTALDSSVRVFDFLSKKELTVSRFKQGGTTLTWASDMVNNGGSQLVVGFSDGVVRILELFNPQSLYTVAGRSHTEDAELRLRQALKPHNASVTAIAFERTGKIMATGSADCTVFFFTVGEKYNPVGFVTVPGSVQGLQWSPQSHEESTLLIFCQNGHVVEVQCPEADHQTIGNTFQLSDLPTIHFCFSSIKSRIKGDAEIALRQARTEEKKKVREERLKKLKEQKSDDTEKQLQEEEEEEEDALPPLYIPSPPSPLHCGFYSAPGSFWLSMGGYDSGYLYHCKFSEQQSQDALERKDEPFSFIPVEDTDHNSILTISFNSNRQLMFCGMEDGSIRVFPIQASDHQLSSMQAHWALNIHDNQYGSVRHIRCSYDDMFVLTTGEDGNIFSFSCLPEEKLQRSMQLKHAKVPSPRAGLEMEKAAPDIDDPSAYSIETAKQKLELDRMLQEAEQRKLERRKRLVELQSQFQGLLEQNQNLPEHIRLHRSELELDPRFHEEIETQTEEKVMEVRRELAWEEERHRLGLNKLQTMFWDSVVQDTVTVYAFDCGHKISTYRLLALSFIQMHLHQRNRDASRGGPLEQVHWWNKAEPAKQISNISFQDELISGQAGVMKSESCKLASRDAEKLRKAAEKAEKARARIEKRRKDWEELYASKPSEDYEDPNDVEAIRLAKEKMGDFKLKTAEDFTVPEHMRMNEEKKRVQLVELEKKIYEKKSEMNACVMALRDSKVEIIAQLHSQVDQLQMIQQRLPPEKRRPLPSVPVLMPEEMPERKHRYTRATLERFATLRAKMVSTGLDEQQEDGQNILNLLEQETQDTEHDAQNTHMKDGGVVETLSQSQEEELTELEREVREVEEIRNLHQQDTILKQMEETVWSFDAELRILRHEKQELDVYMKLADLRHVTLLEELLLLKDFEKRESILQERLNNYIQEENEIAANMCEHKHQIEVKKREIHKLQGKEKSIAAAFRASLGENNKFEEFLTRVFKKKIKRVKKKETSGSKCGNVEEDDDSDEDSDEESDRDNDEDYDDSESGAPLDDRVCPSDCNPELFESTLRLRERRLEVEEQIQEEMKSIDSLKKECDALAKKEKIVQNNRKAAEGDMELINREKQQKLNEVDVVVPLRLHQIEYVSSGLLPGKLDSALQLNTDDLERLQKRIKELQQEKTEQRELYKRARHQHVQLRHELKDMEARIKESEVRSEQQMLMKFGRLVDLEVLQTLSGNRKLEEMRQEIREQEAKYIQELKHWEANVTEAREALTEITQQNTERLSKMHSLLSQKNTLDDQLNSRQRKTVSQIPGRHLADKQELQRLHQLVEAQAQDIEALQNEIRSLLRKDSIVLPPLEPVMPTGSTLLYRNTASTHTHSRVLRKHSPSSKAVK